MKRIGFQTLEEVEKYLSGDKIQCLLCGKWFVALGQHIAKSHDISIPEYKVEFNIPHSRGLVGAELKRVMRERNKDAPWLAKMIEAGKRKSAEKGRKQNPPTRFRERQQRENAAKARKARHDNKIRIMIPCRVCGKELMRTAQTKNPICKPCENRKQYEKQKAIPGWSEKKRTQNRKSAQNRRIKKRAQRRA
jgi:hypothetical protein